MWTLFISSLPPKKNKMYSKKFQELVNSAYVKSNEFYRGKQFNEPNPYYLGFGNPNSKILILGNEKSIKAKQKEKIYTDSTINSESIQNPNHWKKIITDNITDISYDFQSKTGFKNPLYPYYKEKTNKMGTWAYYQKLIKEYYPELDIEKTENSFFKKVFISEINHEVSKKQLGNQRNPIRTKLLNHEFYKSFPITILAVGGYLTRKEIEKRFNVEFADKKSKPNKKLEIYQDTEKERLVVCIRQLSNFRYDKIEIKEYFEKIINSIKEGKK